MSTASERSPSLYEIVIDTTKYQAVFASTKEQLDAICKLRHDVFNLELGASNKKNAQRTEDRDEYDSYFDHLLVTYKPTNEVIGTYRLQTNEMASNNKGFYTSNEFDLTSLPDYILENSIEVGRACIAKNHRNKGALFLMWKGIAQYHMFHKKRFLFGCSSAPYDSPYCSYYLMNYFINNGYLHKDILLKTTPTFAIDIHRPPPTDTYELKVPQLLRIYLKYFSKICSYPALDKEFNTIDFVTLMDTQDLSQRQYDALISL